MPIYEYECENCGRTFEVLQKFSDAPLTSCDCSGKLRKLISQSSFHLKGSGWYVTDYKGKNAGSQAGTKESSDSATSGASTEKTKTETKSSDSSD